MREIEVLAARGAFHHDTGRARPDHTARAGSIPALAWRGAAAGLRNGDRL